ncbi:MAG: NAD-dependent epimerase/dehydratase family protein [Dehalococcoidia bacterium]|nr:NAD-dependent epimerase/dehydratase family protein [Dehalococcoidia bacterium]
MRVLVTGGGGYIGSVLVRRLLDKGHAVRVVDRLYWGMAPLAEVLPRIEVVHADIRDARDEWFTGIDGIVHLAGLSNDPTANFDPEANWQMNAVATAEIAAACLRAGVQRFVFGSSCSLYDGLPDGATYDEDAPIAPRGPYAESKRYAEESLLQMAADGFCPVILRQGTVYGVSPRMRLDLVVNTFVKDALTQGRLLLHGGGWMSRPLVDVQDAADAQITALEAPADAVRGQIFNVVQDNYQIRDLAMQVAESVGQAHGSVAINMAPEPALVRNYRCANDKLYDTLGFRPARGVTQSVDEMVAAFGGMDTARLAHPRYYNLDWLVLLTEAHAGLRPFGYVLRRGEGARVSE